MVAAFDVYDHLRSAWVELNEGVEFSEAQRIVTTEMAMDVLSLLTGGSDG